MTKRRGSIIICCIAAVTLMLVTGWYWYRGRTLYTVTILPSLGGSHILVRSINDCSQVVGEEFFGIHDRRLFLWDRQSGIRDLGPVTGHPLRINNAGQVCGTMIDPNGNAQAFLWKPGKGRTMLGVSVEGNSFAAAINNHGQIVGYSLNLVTKLMGIFFWDEATGMKELSRPGRSSCEPLSIDDRGRIFAFSKDTQGYPTRWYLFDANGATLLDAAPPDASPHPMNRHGWLATVDKPSSEHPYLILWHESGSVQRLFPVSSSVFVTRLNDRNQVACTFFVSSRWKQWRDRLLRRPWLYLYPWPNTSYLWDPKRGKIPLDRYVPDAETFIVKDLNNHGCIVGEVLTKNGQWQAVLLEPIPDRWGR
jgi:probable HAF family extracellular repeat protein